MSLIPFVVCALRDVYDPEVGLNVVELGLVYQLSEKDGQVRVQMTMTHRQHALARYITGMAEATIRQKVNGVRSVTIEVVWDPPWQAAMMDAAARSRLVHT
jgi:metal-sulfur cluster biosynthetic enzyme